jgi:hypothetical protein
MHSRRRVGHCERYSDANHRSDSIPALQALFASPEHYPDAIIFTSASQPEISLHFSKPFSNPTSRTKRRRSSSAMPIGSAGSTPIP